MNKFTVGCAVASVDPSFRFDVGNVVGLTTNSIGELCVEVKWASDDANGFIHPNKITEFTGSQEDLHKFYLANKKS